MCGSQNVSDFLFHKCISHCSFHRKGVKNANQLQPCIVRTVQLLLIPYCPNAYQQNASPPLSFIILEITFMLWNLTYYLSFYTSQRISCPIVNQQNASAPLSFIILKIAFIIWNLTHCHPRKCNHFWFCANVISASHWISMP